MTTLNEQTADALDRAAAEVDKGWCRGVSHDSYGNVCAMGAFDRVSVRTANWLYLYDTARKELLTVLAEQYNTTNPHPVAHYNDILAKSGDEISACMRKAAVNLRSKT